MSRPIPSAVLVSLGLAAAIHLDWHFSRPTHHQLSLGLSWSWLLAIPVFALVAWYVVRVWPARQFLASLLIVGSGVLAGGVLEPAWEYFIGDASREWAFGTERNLAFLTYTCAGLLAYCMVLAWFARNRRSPIAG
jgi:hypothetical protein